MVRPLPWSVAVALPAALFTALFIALFTAQPAAGDQNDPIL